MDVQPPPWLCMKSKYIHMSMLIQGPKQLGNNINLYLGLLQEELDMLWKTPAKTWDASKGEDFYIRAALIMTVHDYLGYGYVQARHSMDIADARGAWMIRRLSS